MAMAPNNFGLTRTKVDPIGAPRTMRFQDIRGLTSLPAGRVVPLVAIPLLREDALRRASIRFSFEQMETAEILMNGVFVRVLAYFVSWLALDRFDGMDALNRSYKGVAVEGLPVVPFIETETAGDIAANNQILKYLGHHAGPGHNITTFHVEAYNQIWNMRARNRSQDLNQRTRLQKDLAPAFWRHQQFKNVVPSFDQAVIDGEVPLNVVDARMPVSGLGFSTGTLFPDANASVKDATGNPVVYPNSRNITSGGMVVRGTASTAAGIPDVFAELEADGITVSLSNIEMARKTQAFARLKEQYKGLPDEYVIDLLMTGIRVPEQQYNQPILLADQSTVFGMSKRYSTDADAMTESVVNGATFMEMNIRVPQQNPGGVVMVTAEILPEQLFERQRDPLLYAHTGSSWPDYLRDTLDPEKVEVVSNGQVDVPHTDPNGTFGYAPLNWKWMLQQPRIGGKFYRANPADTSNDELRQRLWAVETVNPSLAADFYISTNIHTKPFVVTNQDPFEVVSRGMAVIDGLTVFGGALVESTGSYDEIMALVPQDRIDQPDVMEMEAEAVALEAQAEAARVKAADARKAVAKAAKAASVAPPKAVEKPKPKPKAPAPKPD